MKVTKANVNSPKFELVELIDIIDDVKTLSTASLGADSGITSLLNALIIDEFEAILGYNSAIVTIESENQYDDILTILKTIVNEETLHVGKLQELLKLVSPNAKLIDDGQEVVKDELNNVNINSEDLYISNNPIDSNLDVAHPYMKVETFNRPTASTGVESNNVDEDELCTLSNVDDLF